MEYVDGANLRQLIQAGEVQSESALAIIPQICEALQFAHDEGVVHRDIKPENILVDTSGRAKIVDFGLARLVTSTQHEFTLTGTHQVMGTPRYMAPEQMESTRGVDHRADIYSLGVVFYEMLTGEAPIGQFQPPSKIAHVDRRLDKVVLRAMAKEPDRRFQQASEMQSSVEEISSNSASYAGFSTIAEHEVQKAWHWIVDDFGSTTRQTATLPALLMMAMSVAGVLMSFIPWMDLEIDKLTTTREVPIELTMSVSRSLDGYELWSGIIVASAFAGLALLVTITPNRRPINVGRAVAMTVLAATALSATILFRVDLGYHTFPVKFTELQGNEATDQSYWPMYLSAIEHRLKYRTGFYGSLGLSAGLLLLSATGIRHAVRKFGETPATRDRSSDPPTTTIRFSIPADQEIGPQVDFHFSGLGYRLVEQKPSKWVFQRGRSSGVWSGLCGTDIRAIHTTLTVNSVPAHEGELLVNCVWAVRTTATWIEGRDIKTLQAEGYELQSLLGGRVDEAFRESGWAKIPPFSVGAMIAAALSLLFMVVALITGVVLWQNRVWFVPPVDWTQLGIAGSGIIVTGSVTSLVGIVSMNGIRKSERKVTGLALAFTAAILFPLLLIDAAIYGFLLLVTAMLAPDSSLFLVMAPITWLAVDVVLIYLTWSVVSRSDMSCF